jgi:hypothetical protein
MSTRHNVVLDVWFHDLSLEELPESWLVLEREGDEERAVRFDQVEATIDLDAEPNNAPDCLSALAPAFRATGPASRTQRRWDLQAATQWRGPISARCTLTTCRNFVPQAHAGTAIDRSKQSNCPELRESCSVDAVLHLYRPQQRIARVGRHAGPGCRHGGLSDRCREHRNRDDAFTRGRDACRAAR